MISLNLASGLFQSIYLNVHSLCVCLCHSSNIVVVLVVFAYTECKELNCLDLALLSPTAFL